MFASGGDHDDRKIHRPHRQHHLLGPHRQSKDYSSKKKAGPKGHRLIKVYWSEKHHYTIFHPR